MTKEETDKKALEAAKFIKEYCAKHNDCSKECIFFVSDQEGCYLCNPVIVACDEWDIPTLPQKDEPEEKNIVPFDLSLKEDRDAVIGKRICSKDCDTIVCGCSKYSKDRWEFELSASICPVDARYVMRDFVFADGPNKGKPVGKEIKE